MNADQCSMGRRTGVLSSTRTWDRRRDWRGRPLRGPGECGRWKRCEWFESTSVPNRPQESGAIFGIGRSRFRPLRSSRRRSVWQIPKKCSLFCDEVSTEVSTLVSTTHIDARRCGRSVLESNKHHWTGVSSGIYWKMQGFTASSGRSSVGRVGASQALGREFESRRPLQKLPLAN